MNLIVQCLTCLVPDHKKRLESLSYITRGIATGLSRSAGMDVVLDTLSSKLPPGQSTAFHVFEMSPPRAGTGHHLATCFLQPRPTAPQSHRELQSAGFRGDASVAQCVNVCHGPAVHNQARVPPQPSFPSSSQEGVCTFDAHGENVVHCVLAVHSFSSKVDFADLIDAILYALYALYSLLTCGDVSHSLLSSCNNDHGWPRANTSKGRLRTFHRKRCKAYNNFHTLM